MANIKEINFKLAGKIDGSVGKSFSIVGRQIENLKMKAAKILGVNDLLIKSYNTLTPALNRNAKAAQNVSKFSKIGNALGVMGTKMGALAGPAIAAAAAYVSLKGAIDSTLGAAIGFERQEIAISHWLKNNKKLTDEYIRQSSLIQMVSPFDEGDNEVAMQKSIKMYEGNIKNALRIQRIAQNVATETPGKSLSDVMDAFQKGKMGNYKSLRQLGINVSAKTDGSWDNILNKIDKKFAGASLKFAESFQGSSTIIKNTSKELMENVGSGMLKVFIPKISKIAKWIINNKATIEKWMNTAEKIGTRIGGAIVTTFDTVTTWIRDNRPLIEQFRGVFVLAFGAIKSVVAGLAPIFKMAFDWITNTALPMLLPLIRSVFNFIEKLGPVIKALAPIFESAFKVITAVVKPVLDMTTKMFENLTGIIDMMTDINTLNDKTKTNDQKTAGLENKQRARLDAIYGQNPEIHQADVLNALFREGAFKAYKGGIGEAPEQYKITMQLKYIREHYGIDIKNNKVPVSKHANGGLVTRQQLSYLGEGNKPELVLPLSNPHRTQQLMNSAGLGGVVINQTFNVTGADGKVSQEIATVSKRAVKEALAEIMRDQRRVSFG